MQHRKGTHGHKSIIFFALLILSFCANSTQTVTYKNIQELPLTENEKKKVLDSKIIVDSDVTSRKKMQQLKFYIAGLHKKSCRHALRKLSRYEDFSKHISFVKSSKYQGGRIDLLLDSAILPRKMRLNFQIPRITKPGVFPFLFDIGFLKGLTGNIHVVNNDKKCLFYTSANWEGPDTGYPDTIMEFFSSALSSMSMRVLFRISTN